MKTPSRRQLPHITSGLFRNLRGSVLLEASLPGRLPGASVCIWSAGCWPGRGAEPCSLQASPMAARPGPKAPPGVTGAPSPAPTCSLPQEPVSCPGPLPHLRLLETPALPRARPREVPHYPPPRPCSGPSPLPPHTWSPHLCALLPAHLPPSRPAQTTSTSPSRSGHRGRREEGRARAAVKPQG